MLTIQDLFEILGLILTAIGLGFAIGSYNAKK